MISNRFIPCRLFVVWLAMLLGALPLVAQSNSEPGDRAPEFQQMVRRVALELEHSYGEERADYRQRYRQLGEAIEAWNASSRSDADAEIMAGWLRAALRSVLARSPKPLPPSPQFTATQAVPESPAVEREPAVEPEPKVESVREDSTPPTETFAEDEMPHPAARVSSVDQPAQTVERSRSEGLAPIYHSALHPERPRQQIVKRVDPETIENGQAPGAKEPVADLRTAAPAERLLADDHSSPSLPWAEKATPLSSDADVPTAPAPMAQHQESPDDNFGAATASPMNHPEESLGTTSSASDATNPFVDDPLPADDEVERRQPGLTRRVSVSARPANPAHPNVNLAELRARIEGFDRGLRNVEAQLMGLQTLSPADLTKLARALDDLLNQREFVSLYLGTLTSAESWGLPELRSADSAVEMLSQQIVEQRHALERRAVLDDDDRRRDWLLLQEASRRLTNLGVDPRPN